MKLPCKKAQDLEMQDIGFTGCYKLFSEWAGPSDYFGVCAQHDLDFWSRLNIGIWDVLY